MRMKYALCFKLRAFGRKTTSYQIRMRVTFGGQRVDELSGWNLETPEAWDESAQRVRPGHVGTKGDAAEVINRDLDKMRQVMDAVFSYYTAIEVMPSAKDVDARFREKMGLSKAVQKQIGAPREKATVPKKKKVGFFEAFDEFCRECGEKNAWTKATFQKMGSLREDLKAFRKNNPKDPKIISTAPTQ